MENSLDILVNGGAIGIAIALILYQWQKDKMFNKTLNNHFNHHTDAFDRNTEVLDKNTEALRALENIIKR